MAPRFFLRATDAEWGEELIAVRRDGHRLDGLQQLFVLFRELVELILLAQLLQPFIVPLDLFQRQILQAERAVPRRGSTRKPLKPEWHPQKAMPGFGLNEYPADSQGLASAMHPPTL